MPDDSDTQFTELQATAFPGGDTQAAINVAAQAAEPVELDPEQLYGKAVPNGLEILDLERYRSTPSAKRGTVKVATVESLIDYTRRHLDETTATLWVHPTDGKIRVLLDDHDAEGAGWAEHRVLLDLIPTPEWQHWLKLDRTLVTQLDFAEHVEDGVTQLVEPNAAEMLEIAQSIHATNNASFRSAHRLDNGQVEVAYDEDVQASAGKKGDLTIPQTFELAIAPFIGEDPYKVSARLRYRIQGNNLRIGYTLEQPDEVLRDCLSNIADKLEAEFTGLVFMGEPRAQGRG